MRRFAGIVAEELNSCVVAVHGKDTLKYLQSKCTSDLYALTGAGAGSGSFPAASQYTSFLSAKGRLISGAHVSLASPAPGSEGPTLLLDVPSDTLDSLLAHLRAFRLHAKVEVTDLTPSHAVHALLPARPFAAPLSEVRAGVEGAWASAQLAAAACPPPPPSQRLHCSGYWDTRSAPTQLGARLILPRAAAAAAALLPGPSSQPRDPLLTYQTLRRLAGATEGAECAGLIPLECNLTLLRAIAFDKGCYLGQELVARTHFRGLVRKRVLPFVATPASPASPASAVPASLAALQQLLAGSSSSPGADMQAGDSLVSYPSGEVVGRVVAPPSPASPLGLALLRLHTLAEWLPAVGGGVRGEAPDGSAPGAGNPNRETVGGWPGGAGGGGGALPWQAESLQEGLEGGGVGVGVGSGRGREVIRVVRQGGAAGQGGVAVTPVLPSWWRHLAHGGTGVEEAAI